MGIGTNTPDASAALDITSTTGGFLMPRMTDQQRLDISEPVAGLMVYQTDGKAGFYYFDGSRWDALVGSNSINYSIGDFYQGGVVFYLFEAGDTGYVEGETHGLVCAMSDYVVEWGCNDLDLTGVPNVPYNIENPLVVLGAEIGDGMSNTNAILNDCPNAPAALAARSLGSEWFLPSIKELEQMYLNQSTIEAVSGVTQFGDYYWSSSEHGELWAWHQRFARNQKGYSSKANTYYVRAVRAF